MPRRRHDHDDEPVSGPPADLATVIGLLRELNGKVDRLGPLFAEFARQLGRLSTPVDLLTIPQAAKRIGRCTKVVKQLLAKGVFTDGRPADRRVGGSRVLIYADEVAIYHTEGEKAVRRHRDMLGRL